eukprot:365200-Chlamydomonas_euryale.AAC.7
MAEESWQQLLKMCWALPFSSGKEGSGWPGWHRGSHPCSPTEAPVKRRGRHDRPRPAASTHVLFTDHPASVSHEGKRSGPLTHILHACMHPARMHWRHLSHA